MRSYFSLDTEFHSCKVKRVLEMDDGDAGCRLKATEL